MGTRFNAFSKLLSLSLIVAAMTGCSNASPSFSLLEEQNSFDQIPEITQGKIDILWVIDNSGSMASSQQNVANNFASFIDKFNSKNLDYRMAVITSESYRALFTNDPSWAKFRDGLPSTQNTGVFVITPSTPNLHQTFLTNMLQGTTGSGDERVFQSISTSLSNPINAEFNFPRKDAKLAVIIVSDEDDFSHDTSQARGGQYSFAGLHTVDSYVQFLDTLTGSTADNRQYGVHAITILDQQCLDQLNAESPGRRLGLRYQEIAQKTNGVIGSLCGNFGETLSSISNKIIELSTQFPLSRSPNPATIQVWIDGTAVPQSTTDGWSYNAAANALVFHGSWVPAAGAKITVRFDPTTIK